MSEECVTLAHSAVESIRARLDGLLTRAVATVSNLDEVSAEWLKVEKNAKIQQAKVKNRVKFDIGGTIFETASSNLLQRFPSSLFTVLLSVEGIYPPIDGAYFFDRSPRYFSVILDCLREGELRYGHLMDEEDASNLVEELEFFRIPFTLDASYKRASAKNQFYCF
jgi:hypothetical protein